MSDQNELVDLLVQNLNDGDLSKRQQTSTSKKNRRAGQSEINRESESLNNGIGTTMNGNANFKGEPYASQPHFVYTQPNTDMQQVRDRDWAEYAQMMNLSGAPLNHMVGFVAPDDPSNEADFVQSFVQNPQLMTYFTPGYFHPFTSQLYSDGRNVFANPQLYPYAPPQQYVPTSAVMQEAYGGNPEDIASQPDANAHYFAALSLQDQQIAQEPMQRTSANAKGGNVGKPAPKPSNAPRSWADIANTPAAPKAAPPKPAVPKPQPQQAPPKGQKGEGKATKKPQNDAKPPNPKSGTNTLVPGINPSNFDIHPSSARFFVIKSYSEDDIHKSIKYNIWASTDSGNRRLDSAYKESHAKGPIYLFFSVNASGQFCGMAQMMSQVDYEKKSDVWAQDKWNGSFQVKWLFIKDIPNSHLRHIRLENNDNKPVTNSRDTQEILFERGKEMLKVFASYKAKTSILDDFSFYDKRQEQMKDKKQDNPSDEDDEAQDPQDVPTGSNRAKLRNKNKA